jgi:hypothetical protein
VLTFTLPLRDGLDAQITWLQGKQERLRSLLVDRLLPAVWARGYKNRDGIWAIQCYLDVMKQGLRSERHGAV